MTAVAKSNAREARERAGRIRVGMVQYLHTLADVAAAYAARDWLALGYESWESYVDGEYGAERLRLSPEHRQKAVAELRLGGLSQRAIGTALGVSQDTVRRDLSEVNDSVHLDEVQGADGKTYASTRPQPTETAARDDLPLADGAETDSGAALVHPLAGEGPTDGDSVPASPESVEGTGSGEVTPETVGDLAVLEWRRQFGERAEAVRAGREPYAAFVADFTPGMHLAGPYEHGLMAALQASQTPAHDPAEFAATLDRLVPDDNPHREWQAKFLDAISSTYRITRFTPEDVAERADEELVGELIRVINLLDDYRLRVVNARLASLPDNVTPLRRAQ